MKTLKKTGWVLVLLVLLGCEREELGISQNFEKETAKLRSVGNEENKVEVGEQKWAYKISEVKISERSNRGIGGSYYSEITFDEEDNLYVLIGQRKLISLDKDGRLRWRKTFYEKKKDRVVYYKNRLFIENREAGQDVIYCLNPENGNELWKHDLIYEYDNRSGSFAVGNGKVYAYSSGTAPVLVMYDLDGNIIYQQYKRLLKQVVNTNNENPALLVHNDKVILSSYDMYNTDDGIKYYHTCYQDTGSSLDSIWSFTTSKPYKQKLTAGVGNTFHMLEHKEKNPYGLTQKGDKILWQTYDDKGSKIREVELFDIFYYDDGYNHYLSYSDIYPYNTLLSSQNEEFYKYGNESFIKYDKDGNRIWEMAHNEEKGKVQASGGHILAESGNVYLVQNDTLRCFNDKGVCVWKANKNVSRNTYVEYVAGINHRGDLFVIDLNTIYCYRGINDKLDLKGWPRLFYDYGNTSYKP